VVPVNEKEAFAAGMLPLMILGLLAVDGPSPGDGIARRIGEASGERMSLRYRTLQPAIRTLEQEGFVTVEWRQAEGDGRLLCYVLTHAGRVQLEREKRSWHEIAEIVDEFLPLLATEYHARRWSG
jgi:DNA-binding PadR family transcriptional regulator